jgi:aromatic ring-opening dioxygenase catalytic subunit (LigB family)
MTPETLLQRLKVPLGPALVDLTIATSLIFSAGQMMHRFEMMDARIAEMEQDKLAQRTALIEQRMNMLEQTEIMQRSEIIKRLERIEDKLDGKADRPR